MDQPTGPVGHPMPDGPFASGRREALEACLPAYLRAQRWFSAKARTIRRVRIAGAVPLATEGAAPPAAYITFVEVEYAAGDPQTFVLPLAFAAGAGAEHVQHATPRAVIAPLEMGGLLYDASWDAGFALALLDAIQERRRFGSAPLEIHAWPAPVFGQVAGAGDAPLTPRVVGAEQSNTSIIYGGRLILKLFRRLESGISPDLEIGRFLTAQGFAHTPPLAGALERVEPGREPQTLAILQGFVPNRGDAWDYSLDLLGGYFDRARQQPAPPAPPSSLHILDLAGQEIPPLMREILGDYLLAARLLGRRTAEMHLALASGSADPAFAPVPLTHDDQRALYDSALGLAGDAFRLLRARLPALSAATRDEAEAALALQQTLPARLQPLLDRAIPTLRTRVHGDYHLGQVLFTGSDFVIIDFEGEPLRSLAERRRKQSPLKDVAGMLRSFHYAAYAALFRQVPGGADERLPGLALWTDACHEWVSAAFLAAYLQVAQDGAFLPRSHADLQVLLDAYLLEKAIYELIYELNNRPDWVRIPLQGIRQLAG